MDVVIQMYILDSYSFNAIDFWFQLRKSEGEILVK